MDENRKNSVLEETLKKLDKGVEELFTSAKYADYLRTMGKFYRYSFNNTLLIALQNPSATYVASYSAWKKKFHRYVNAGEKGMKIIAPMKIIEEKELDKIDPLTSSAVLDENGNAVKEKVQVIVPRFKVATVFDISQTSGKELPTIGVAQLNGKVPDYDNFIEALEKISPVPVSFEDIKGKGSGYYDDSSKKIAIKTGMSQKQTMKTAVHEIAHAMMHSSDKKKNKVDMKRNTKEVQAESVAFTVCDHFGLPTDEYSFGYIAGWSKNTKMEELRSSMDEIRKTAGSIIEGLEQEIKELELGQRRFEIYKLKNPKDIPYGNKDFDESERADCIVHVTDYVKTEGDRMKEEDTLDSIYKSYSTENIPEDHAADKLKTSDVIVIKDKGEASYYYVENEGLREISDFEAKFTALEIASNIDELMHSYDVYGYNDMIDDRQENVISIQDQIQKHNTKDIKEWLEDVKQDKDVPECGHSASLTQQKLDIFEKQNHITSNKEAEVSYYVAECMEFPVAGEYYETDNIEMAKSLYDSIPSERMNAVKGIGASIKDSNGIRDVPLVKNDSYQKELLEDCVDMNISAKLRTDVYKLEKYFIRPSQEKALDTSKQKGDEELC